MGNAAPVREPYRIPPCLLFALFKHEEFCLPREIVTIILILYDDLFGWRFDLGLKSNLIDIDPSHRIASRQSAHEGTYSGFALMTQPITSHASKFTVQLLPRSKDWVGVGIADTTIMKNFDFTFSKYASPGHGFFGISSNGYSWNSNCKTENAKSVAGREFSHPSRVGVSYNSKTGTADFYIDDVLKTTLTDIPRSKNLRFCVRLGEPSNAVKILETSDLIHLRQTDKKDKLDSGDQNKKLHRRKKK